MKYLIDQRNLSELDKELIRYLKVKDEQNFSESEKAILKFNINLEDEEEFEKAKLLMENKNKRIYQKYIDYNSGLEKLLDKFSEDKVSYSEGYYL